ncbi:MAG: peptide chain release factor N(5)-glutamine methyltransferase [Planctomycetes bacterium]|nr:peptide chain release factor N(5)-glutamine methyltransferase [Planctomycetota bacterium]
MAMSPAYDKKPAAKQTDPPWTTKRLLQWINAHLQGKGVDSPRVVAEMLLSHVIGCDRMQLYMEVDRPANPDELSTLRGLVERAARHEPAQYLVGHAWFYSRRIQVDGRVLIPRPSTETLIEHVLQWLKAAPGHAEPIIADVGTGSGVIAITLAAQLTDSHIIATDISADALELAKQNAQSHDVADRIEFHQGKDLEPLKERMGKGDFDLICSNPPYISDSEWEEVATNVRDYEPANALRGGKAGLDVIKQLIANAADLLRPDGQLVIEIADSQKHAVLQLVADAQELDNAVVLKDHEGFWRVLVADRVK